MAKIDDYWIFLPEHDNAIYKVSIVTTTNKDPQTIPTSLCLQELHTFVNNKSADGFSSLEMEKSTLNFLRRCLRTACVATCKILQLMPSFIADEIYHSVLLDLLVDITVDKTCNQFLAILMNGQFSADLIARFEVEIFPKLVNVLVTNKDIDRQLKVCLAFANDDKFRDRFLFIEDRLCADDLISKRRMFVLTAVDKQHFVEKFIDCDDVTRSKLSNDVLQRALFVVQMLRTVDRSNNYKQFLHQINQWPMSSSNNCFRRNLFNELQRLLNLKELFSVHIPNVPFASYASRFNVIDILFEHVNLSTADSQSVCSILEENRKYNQRFQLCGNESAGQLTELEMYNNFSIVKLLLEVIMDNQPATVLNESSVDKLNEVKTLLSNVDAIATFTNILETAFSLIFIRWDNLNLNGDANDADGNVEESGSETTKSPKCLNRTEKTTFICNAVALDNILSLLKDSALEPCRSDALASAVDSVKDSFRRVHDNINDAHWRVEMFCAHSTVAGSRSASFVNDDLRKYFTAHKSRARENSNGSSDDERSDQPEASVYRRKPRKKNPLRKSIDDKNLVISNSTEHEQRSDTLYRSISGVERRCPVSRMLGSPEHLATVCLNNGNFAATKDVVEVRN